MNTIKTSVLAIALAIGSITYANTASTSGIKPNSITKAVSKLLEKHTMELSTELQAKVTFTVNKHNEIVVIDVDSDSKRLIAYVKSRLNYKKLKAKATTGKMYFLPIKVQRSQR